jgi:hypothetical protein
MVNPSGIWGQAVAVVDHVEHLHLTPLLLLAHVTLGGAPLAKPMFSVWILWSCIEIEGSWRGGRARPDLERIRAPPPCAVNRSERTLRAAHGMFGSKT